MRARLPELSLLLVVTIWGSTFVLTKQAFAEISALAFVFARFVGIAALALGVLALSVRAGRASWSIRRHDLGRFVVVGLCGYTFYQLGFVLGLDRTSPFSSSLLIGTVPLFTIVVLAVLGERSPLRAWLGVLVALLGTAVFVGDKFGSPSSLVGDLLSLGSALSFALYGVLNRRLVRDYPTATYSTYTVLAGAIPLLLLSAPAAAAQPWGELSPSTWLVIVYMIVLPVYVAYLIWNWAIAQRGAATASAYSLLTPVVSGLLAVLAGVESLGPGKLVGGALVLLGLVVLQTPAARRSLEGAESTP